MTNVSNLPPPSPGPPNQPAGPGWAPSAPPAPWSPAGAWPTGGRVPPQLGGVYYSPGLVILLTIVTFGIWALVWSYRTGDDLKRYNGDGLGGGLMLVIAIIGSPVVMFLIPNEIENMYRRDGRVSPVSALLGLWFLLPLIGNIIWYVKVQRALNDFWQAKGARPG